MMTLRRVAHWFASQDTSEARHKRSANTRQQCRLTPVTAPHQWHDQLAAACRDLASLSQAGARIEPLIKAGKVSAAEQALLRCVKVANHLSTRLNELKRKL